MRHQDVEYYKNYYLNQAQQKGGHLNVFHGARNQKGYGLGSIFRGLYRWAIPHIKSGAKTIGQRALKEGVGVAQDVLDGQNITDSVVNRGKKVIGSLNSQDATRAQRGNGRKPTKRKAPAKPASRAPAKRQKRAPAKKTTKSNHPDKFFETY